MESCAPTPAPARAVPASPDASRVILVEDDPALLRSLARIATAAGFEVTTAENGAVALDLLSTTSFDAVVSDIQMPALDGMGLLRALRERGQDVPVVLMSAAPTVETAM